MIKGKYSKLSKQFILSHISQEDIFSKFLDLSNISRYLQNDNTMFVNNTRTDNLKTCTFWVYPNGLIWFRDWADSKGYDCFGLVQKLYNNCTWYETLEVIATHFNLLDKEQKENYKYIIDPKNLLSIKQKEKHLIRIKRKEWNNNEIKYWEQYELYQEDEEIKDIFPIKCYWFDDKIFYPNNLAFAYHFPSEDSIYDYKLYFPEANKLKKELRFLHNNADKIQGENDLKFNKRSLIITSSYKDVKVLRKIERLNDLNFETISPMSESTPVKKEKLDLYKSKYEYVFYYYNNDEAGIRLVSSQTENTNIGFFYNPLNEPKDPSDLIKKYKLQKGTEIIKQLLYDNIPPF